MKRLATIVLSSAAALAFATPAYAAPSATGMENGGPNSNGCTKQVGTETTEGKQKVNPNAHKGVGGEYNYPSNCDHYFQYGV